MGREIFNYFEQPITNAYTESLNSLARQMNRMGRGYSFDVIRARLLYDTKARKDGAQIIREPDPKESNFIGYAMPQSTPISRQRVIEYGPYIPTLVKLLELGYFET